MKKLWRLRQKIDAAHRFFDSGELPRPDGSFLLPSSTTNKGDLMMTDQNETNSKKPTHTVYFVKEKENQKADWIQVGAAWSNADGKGLNLSLDILGQKVALTVRQNKPKTE